MKTLELFDYQQEGVRFLVAKKRAILADEMGLGKTVQALKATCTSEDAKILVLCPETLKWNWAKEIQKWLPGVSHQIVEGAPDKRRAQILAGATFTISNMESLTYTRASAGQKKGRPWNDDVKLLARQKWSHVIVDEAHRLKNRKTQVKKAVLKICKVAQAVYMLTGTPIQNRADELWSLLNILYPKHFSSYWRFAEKFCYITVGYYGNDVGGIRDEKLPELRGILEQISLRRLKSEVLPDLPGKMPIKQVWVHMKADQAKLYLDMASEMYLELTSGEEITASVVVEQITRLKQIAIDPGLMVDRDTIVGPKVDALLDLLEAHPDEKIVVFSQFTSVLHRLKPRLEKLKITYESLTGDMSGEARSKAVDRFEGDPDCQVFLCSMGAGGVGINLTSSHIAVFMDKHWTPTTNWQSQERLDRIGQTEKVTIVEILTTGTVEEAIEDMLLVKTDTFKTLFSLSDPGLQTLRPVNKIDLLEVLRHGLEI